MISHNKPKKVLLMDGHKTFRRFMGIFLSDHFEIATADNPLEAMAWIHKGFVPDCIVADAQGGAGAHTLLQHLQCTGMYSDIPVVITGGKIQQTEMDQYVLLGASNYFQKPFNPVYLKNYLLQQMQS
jgi:DNA-binding NtrC family response regulator